MTENDKIKVRSQSYRQHEADYSQEVPAEAFGGWQENIIEISPSHTAIVVMHTFDFGTSDNNPRTFKSTEYIPRSYKICRQVLKPFLSTLRQQKMQIIHVAGTGYADDFPGYKKTLSLCRNAPEVKHERVKSDPVYTELHKLQREFSFGPIPRPKSTSSGFKIGFHPDVLPENDEYIATTSNQLFNICKKEHINHLIYCGFAINWCLLLSPGGMADMQIRHGIICSAFRQATTAVENKETARRELHKESALWRVAVNFGFVFNVDAFIEDIRAKE